MARYTHFALLLLLVTILCSSCSVFAFTATPPLYKVEVLEPKPNAVIPAGKPIKLKIKTEAPQGPEILELFCELVQTFALPAPPGRQATQEVVVGIINKQIITKGTFTYQVVTDTTKPNTLRLGYGKFVLRIRQLYNAGTSFSTRFNVLEIPITVAAPKP